MIQWGFHNFFPSTTGSHFADIVHAMGLRKMLLSSRSYRCPRSAVGQAEGLTSFTQRMRSTTPHMCDRGYCTNTLFFMTTAYHK